MTKIRVKHDAVFKSVGEKADQLRKEPHLLSQLPCIIAVNKEVLCLYPPASAIRGGQLGKQLRDDRGYS